MARPQAADYDQRRAAIVEQAARLFATKGFAGSSVADLARACDTSKSLIYHYFPSKEDILHAVMAGHVSLLEQDVAQAMAQAGSARDRLRLVIQGFMRHYIGAANAHTVLLNDLDSLPDARRTAIVRQQRGVVAAVTDLFAAIFPDLAADPPRARATAMLLFGMINWTHTWYDPAGPVDPDTLADMALAMALRQPSDGTAQAS